MHNYAAIFVSFLLATVPVSANPDVSKAATSLDYSSIRPLAEQGDAVAQIRLGLMYASGIGVVKNDAEAVRWFRLAADQGNAGSQYNLGIGYANGSGVAQDYVQAYKWLNIAAAAGFNAAISMRDELQKKMKKQDVLTAKKLSSNWLK